MAVDPQKPRVILVVHGVQTGTDLDQNQHELIAGLVRDRLGGIPLDFQADIYRYENLNDQALEPLQRLLSLVTENLLARRVLSGLVDLIGDVVIALADGTTAARIRDGLTQRVLGYFEQGNPLYIVAHSLGTIYAFDVVNALVSRPGYFDRNSRKTWPVQGLVTLGSPIGLDLFGRDRVAPLGAGQKFLRWINYWSRTDPIVSGSIFGRPDDRYVIAERFDHEVPDSGWMIQDRAIDNGRTWLLGHVDYWRHPGIGDDLITLLAN